MPPVIRERWLAQPDSTSALTASKQRRDPGLDSSSQQLHSYAKRALQTNVIPLSYNLSGASAGATVGITLGAVAGFLLLFWLIWFATLGRPSGLIEGDEITDIHVARSRRSDRSERRSRRSRRTRTAVSEMSERTRSRTPPPPRRTERIVVDETTRTTTRREHSRAPSRPAPPASDFEREEVFEEADERRVEGDDVVEVEEDESTQASVLSPPRRQKSKSGYRTVDPSEYAGGNYPRHEVDRERRRSSRR